MEIFSLQSGTVSTVQNNVTKHDIGIGSNAGLQNNQFLDALKPSRLDGDKKPDANDLSATSTSTAQSNNAAIEKSLEKMIISMMMKPLFTEFAKFTFGDGVEAEVYTSLFSEAVADKIAVHGTLGLEKYTADIATINNKSTK